VRWRSGVHSKPIGQAAPTKPQTNENPSGAHWTGRDGLERMNHQVSMGKRRMFESLQLAISGLGVWILYQIMRELRSIRTMMNYDRDIEP
jgi:hypothetical protein